MSVLEALILGIVQGLTEFLPVSSSGHIELGKALLGTEAADDLLFTLVVHLATTLSILIVFRKDIWALLSNLFTFQWNEGNRYITYLLLSAVPIGLVGVLWKDEIQQLFEGRLLLVGCMLLVTGVVLLLSTLEREKPTGMTWWRAAIIGIGQAIAIMPGISRSGMTISSALALGVSREEAARFSFLMVLLPIIGGSLLMLKDHLEDPSASQAENLPLLVGFLAAFISGWAACKVMLAIVKRGKITWFSAYCFAVGLIAIVASQWG